MNKKRILSVLAAVLVLAVFFAGCPSSPSSLTDEEKAVLVNRQ